MDRRGSGINRIMNAYADCKEKPKFFSEASQFLVTLPNKSSVSKQESALPEGKSALPKIKTKLSKEEEQQEFKLRVEGELYGTAFYRTQNNLIKMFNRYGYEYSFNSINICECFNVKERRALKIIQLLIEKGFVFKQKPGEYYFKKL